jgi:hypothetical protein
MTIEYIYDLETYRNVFTITIERDDVPFVWAFEISPRRNDARAICSFLTFVMQTDGRMVGFNNLGFDYPVIHELLRNPNSTAESLYAKAMSIIGSQDQEDRWAHQVYPGDRVIPQIDLFKIWHFDNKARATSLKAIAFAMRSEVIEELPFPVGSVLTNDQIDVLLRYNHRDVRVTKDFLRHTRPMIAFREELVKKYPGKDWINFNDTKIGKQYFIQELERQGVPCYDVGPAGRTPRQTPRPTIRLGECILPWIEFEQPELTRVLNWFKAQTITETKGVFKDVTATINGFTFVFGLGGIHGSVSNRVFEADEEWAIVDLDVTSMYPSVAIVNRFYPEHLGEKFCDIYSDLFTQRKQYPKKSSESATIKLGLNGVYGDSNNKFSPFLDPKYTMSVTLNGQMMLCKLAEMLVSRTSAELIQVNTDGVTIKVHRLDGGLVNDVRRDWEALTKLSLEEARYRRMFVADVNSYLAEYEDGSVKRKGRYEWDVEWHQDASAIIVAKVAEQVLLHDAPIRQTVERWPDIMDFMLRIKVPKSGHLQWGDAKVQNLSRYYVAKTGKHLTKWLPPMKGKTEWRSFGVEAGWDVQVCNDMADATEPVDFGYYVNEIEKLVLGMR